MDVSANQTADIIKTSLPHVMLQLGRDASVSLAIRVALVASCRDRDDLVQTLFSQRDARSLTPDVLDGCRLSAEQFGAIARFCVTNSSVNANNLVSEDHAQDAIFSIESALRCTLEEDRQCSHWQKAAVRVSCALAMYFEEPLAFVDSCVWGVVRADNRRLEEVRRAVESVPVPLLFVGGCIEALAQSFA